MPAHRPGPQGAVVTGGTGGIGRAVVELLLQERVPVAFTYRQDATTAQALLDQATRAGVPATGIRLDLTHADAGARLLAAATTAIGVVDVLVNTAGGGRRQRLDEIGQPDWQAVLDLNLFATFGPSQAFGQHFYDQGHGAIVNVSSTAAEHPLPRSPHYAAAKAGIHGLTRALATTLAPHVVVNAIAPGFVTTPRRPLDPGDTDLLPQIPLRRFATPANVAAAIRFLADPDSYITGQILTIDGGLTL